MTELETLKTNVQTNYQSTDDEIKSETEDQIKETLFGKIRQQGHNLYRLIQEMKERQCVSWPWTIGEHPRFMCTLQILVFAFCITNFGLTIHEWKFNECHENVRFLGPFQNGDMYCSWPEVQNIIRAVISCAGAISSLLYAIFTDTCPCCCTSCCSVFDISTQVKQSVSKGPKEGELKWQYYDIYQHWGFRILRKLVSFVSYMQLFLCGLDYRSLYIGTRYCSINVSKECNNTQFINIVVIGFIVWILLRWSHDSMFQREKALTWNWNLEQGEIVMQPNVKTNMQPVNSVANVISAM